MKIKVKFDTIEEMVEFANSVVGVTVDKPAILTRNVVKEDAQMSEDLFRLDLEDQAHQLGIKFRSDIKTDTLQSRVEDVLNKPAKDPAETTTKEIMEAALDAEGEEDEEELQKFIDEADGEPSDDDSETSEPSEPTEPDSEEPSEVENSKPARKKRKAREATVDADDGGKTEEQDESEEEDDTPTIPKPRRRRPVSKTKDTEDAPKSTRSRNKRRASTPSAVPWGK